MIISERIESIRKIQSDILALNNVQALIEDMDAIETVHQALESQGNVSVHELREHITSLIIQVIQDPDMSHLLDEFLTSVEIINTREVLEDRSPNEY